MHSKDSKAGAPGAVRNSGPQEARVASGMCFLFVFTENVLRVFDFRLFIILACLRFETNAFQILC